VLKDPSDRKDQQGQLGHKAPKGSLAQIRLYLAPKVTQGHKGHKVSKAFKDQQVQIAQCLDQLAHKAPQGRLDHRE
jgi:hypothetical protein